MKKQLNKEAPQATRNPHEKWEHEINEHATSLVSTDIESSNIFFLFSEIFNFKLFVFSNLKS